MSAFQRSHSSVFCLIGLYGECMPLYVCEAYYLLYLYPVQRTADGVLREVFPCLVACGLVENRLTYSLGLAVLSFVERLSSPQRFKLLILPCRKLILYISFFKSGVPVFSMVMS